MRTNLFVIACGLALLALAMCAVDVEAAQPMWFPDGVHVCTPVTGSGEGDGSGLPGTFEVTAYSMTVGGYTAHWLIHPRFGLMEWSDATDQYENDNGDSFVHDADPANIVLPDPPPPPPFAGGYDEQAADGTGHSGWWIKK